MHANAGYKLVTLANGSRSIHSLAERETFHPVIGPAQEARALYVEQLKLRERVAQTPEEFVIWDVGLGAAANPAEAIRALAGLDRQVRILSFDHTLEPLAFALEHANELGYLTGLETPLRELLNAGRVTFTWEQLRVDWEVFPGDFPSRLAAWQTGGKPANCAPHAILFDAYSPARNPTMWTLPLFARLYGLLDPQRPCALPTYSRSTLLRVTLLLAGFFVGAGHATGEKEETTLAANCLELLAQPLDRTWLTRAHRSTSAEPMVEPVYQQSPLRPETWEKLRQHPQFAS
jgi:hypothetical protein